MDWLRPIAALALLPLLPLLACYQPDYGSKACVDGAGCPAGYACVGGRCQAGDAPAPADARVPTAEDGGAPDLFQPGAEVTFMKVNSFRVGTDGDSINGFDIPAFTINVLSFAIDRAEVRTAEYQRCVDAGKCTPAATGGFCNYGRADRGEHPINCVDFNQASDYCRWVGRRLPTEIEWELAARGTEGRTYPWGNEAPTLLNLCWAQPAVGTCKEGLAPNNSKVGLVDLAGNVWEWTSSPACEYPDRIIVCKGPNTYVVRGASWSDNDPRIVRATTRLWNEAKEQHPNRGFRCARTL